MSGGSSDSDLVFEVVRENSKTPVHTASGIHEEMKDALEGPGTMSFDEYAEARERFFTEKHDHYTMLMEQEQGMVNEGMYPSLGGLLQSYVRIFVRDSVQSGRVPDPDDIPYIRSRSSFREYLEEVRESVYGSEEPDLTASYLDGDIQVSDFKLDEFRDDLEVRHVESGFRVGVIPVR